MEDNQGTGPSLGHRLRATQLAAADMNPAVTMGDPAACWTGLSWEEPGVWDLIPILVATRVRLATVAVSVHGDAPGFGKWGCPDLRRPL